MELCARVFPPTDKHVPDLHSETEEQLQHQTEKSAAHFPGSEVGVFPLAASSDAG